MKCSFLIIAALAGAAFGCTTIAVTPAATVDGSMYVTHSDDNELMDERLIYVPAMDHDPGAERNIYCSACALGEFPQYNSFSYPRLVCSERGPGYDTEDREASIPLGTIPQVVQTYAYFDGSYGIMNEHQLMIGECTCGAKIQLDPEPGKRIFYSSELSRVALERCSTAVEAVQLMGDLIQEYGYYGTGETLLVGDPNEVWVMEMCCGTMDSTGGLWVARRVPDGHLFVAANEFRIRDIDPENPDIMYSDNLFETCEARGWWSPDEGTLDWLRAVSLGEYNHPYYSLRRVWRVLSFAAPSKQFSPWVENGYTRDYPFSVEPDTPLDTRSVMALHRDHYEGTPFDMTMGPAAGPFGYPYRYYGSYDPHGDVGDPNMQLEGAWERPLSVDYCGYLYVNQGRSWLPDRVGGICWFGPDKPSETCFVPFFCGVTNLPSSYQTCNTSQFSRESAWWAFNFVADWAAIKYSYIRRDIQDMQDRIELREIDSVARFATITGEMTDDDVAELLTEWCASNADSVVTAWWDFSEELIVKYDDGYINSPQHMAHEEGYPGRWLETTEWPDGPTHYSPPDDRAPTVVPVN
ncbi:MAG: dipeptidase [Candidatus Aegiribacteria sp.]|nr:dipeptidase [Candidatus Aegiribacteria sp.]MBD3294090.1 dipeptidase [Candidatus Fermentibacteria bacterium]